MLIVRVPRDGAVVARIRAELEANDFWVREIGPDATSARTPLPLLAGNASARAALRMQSAGTAIELWVASEGGASGGGEVVRLPDAERDDALLAVRATEAMRARGLKLPKRSAPSSAAAPGGGGSTVISGGTPSTTSTESAEAERARKQAEEQARAQAEAQRQAEAQKQAEAQRQAEADAEAAAAEAARRAQAEREAEERAEAEREAEAQRQAEAEADEAESEQDARSPASPALLYVELGPAIAASPDDVTASGGGFLNLRLQPSATWSVSGFAFVPFIGGDFEQEGEGRGRIRSYMFGALFDLHAMLPELEISAGAGAAFLLSHITADPDPITELVRKQNLEDRRTGAVLARAAMHVEVAPRVRIGLRVIFGLALPQLTVKFADKVIARWGRPFVLGALTLDWGVL